MPNECKLFAPPRLQGRERKGAHPRAPRVPDVTEPTQALAPPPPPVPAQQIDRDLVPDLVGDES
eukprot:8235443-Prorocentrum_lima.AAC.1